MNWMYDHLAWWADAVHRSCSHMRSLPGAKRTPVDWAGNDAFLGQLGSWYNETLTLLAKGTLSAEHAATLLFRAKSLKKWRLTSGQAASDRRERALLGFAARNDAAASAGLIPYPYSVWMREYLKEALPEPSPGSDLPTGRFGPGQVYEGVNHIHRFCKLNEWIADVHWPEVPPKSDDCQQAIARLAAVPKDALKDRLITVESAYSSFAQQYVRQLLQLQIHVGRLHGTCMDLGSTDGQAIQRNLALKGSRTGRLATLDLSDASDNITWSQVQQVFPGWVTALLDVTRSSAYQLGRGEATKPLYIFAGMGNATTFTVETLFFSAFVYAYARAHGLKTFVSVFGDDIVCHSDTASALMKEDFSFFRINHAKSFLCGDSLREACGIFAYKGIDITCPKVDGYRNDITGRVGVCELHQRLMYSQWPYGRRLAGFIARLGVLVNWPFVAEGYPSIDDDRFPRSLNPQTRINRNIQCVEALLPRVEPVKRSFCTWATDAKRWNHPSPEIWLDAWYCGMLGRRDFSITSERARRRLSIDWPVKDQFRLAGRRWLTCQCAIDDALSKGCRFPSDGDTSGAFGPEFLNNPS